MNTESERKAALNFSHFPTRMHCFVWRNWEKISIERMAEVVKTSPKSIEALAAGMGLPVPATVDPLWLSRGYITIIRQNWHLLPMNQLVKLLGWDAEKMQYTLQEDDFLGFKLGKKPVCQPLVFTSPSEVENASAQAIKNTLEEHFPGIDVEEKPFEFLTRFQDNEGHISRRKDTFQGEFEFVLAYSYAAVYGDPLLDPELDPYPEGMLARFADLGVNAIWLQGLLYTLIPWEIDPELSKGWERRLENLRTLCARAEKYGIGVYLYLNEPRGMSGDFYQRHPSLKGNASVLKDDIYAMCTSNPKVLDRLRNATERLFREVRGLAGLLTITMSENMTHCHSEQQNVVCPACSKRQPAEVVAEVNAAIAEGAHLAKPEARIVVWTWGWDDAWATAAIDRLPVDVEVMCTSERELATKVGGVEGKVIDYSMSKIGPGPHAEKWWCHAKNRGMKVHAKIQMNNTWECSAVPYIPVPFLVQKHLDNVIGHGVSGIMLSWTTGGYPGGNLELLSHSPNAIAQDKFGAEATAQVLKAWKRFGEAFKEFPLNRISQLYFAPQNYGPMSLMYEKPTGYRASMIVFPYDDLQSWRGRHYPEDVFEDQFRKLSEGWAEGLSFLEHARTMIPDESMADYQEMSSVATATYAHFRSTFNQIRFVRTRDSVPIDRERIQTILDDEIKTTKTLAKVVTLDSRIGFEASNHYYYTINELKEKILNCEYLKKEI